MTIHCLLNLAMVPGSRADREESQFVGEVVTKSVECLTAGKTSSLYQYHTVLKISLISPVLTHVHLYFNGCFLGWPVATPSIPLDDLW